MRFAEKSCSDREAGGAGGRGAAWLCPARCHDRGWIGAWTVARIVRRRTGGQRQFIRFHSDAGVPREPSGDSVILAARGGGRAAGLSSCIGIGRNRNGSKATGFGRSTRSGNIAACGSRGGPLRWRGGRSDRVVAQPARARPDCEQAAGLGGGGVGCHGAAPPCGGAAQSQCRADTLEHSRRAFRCAGSRSARPACFQCRIAASARSAGWRSVASGMGS